MQVKAFFGSGSRESFIHPSFTLGAQISLVVNLLSGTESMATSASSSVKVRGTCVANVLSRAQVPGFQAVCSAWTLR